MLCEVARTTGWCPLCYEGKKGRRTHVGHFGWRAVGKDRHGVALQHLRKRGSAGDGGSSAVDMATPTKHWQAMPALWEFLTVTVWDDGEERRTGTLLLFTEEGRWKCCVNDRDAGLVTFVAAESPDQLLRSVDKGLVEDTLDWRKSQGAPTSRRKS